MINKKIEQRNNPTTAAAPGGNIPVISVTGKTLPDAWEQSVLRAWNEGLPQRTEYDKPGDPPSRDCTMIMTVLDPRAEPRIHRAIPCAIDDLEVYRQEVVDGIHDHWIAPEEGKWTYTYHQRLAAFPTEGKTVDQLDYIVRKLAEAHHTRRAQAITWNPLTDAPTDDPPCLQRVWCRLAEREDGALALNMNTHWRSRDAYKAAFMNIFALTDLQRLLAAQLAEKTGKRVVCGRYTDISDSYHIYGSYFAEFEGFLKLVEKRTFEERAWDTAFAEPFFEQAREKLEKEKEAGETV